MSSLSSRLRTIFSRTGEGKENHSNEEVVLLTQKIYKEEFTRLGISNLNERLKRLRSSNFKFHKIPVQEHANGLFKHVGFVERKSRGVHVEIEVDQELQSFNKLGTSVHESAHAMSSSGEDESFPKTGFRKNVAELALWGYCGLDEGLIEHFTQHALLKAKGNFKNFDQMYKQRKDNHAYAPQVMFWENMMREIARKDKKENESEQAAFERVRDLIYKQFFERRSGEIFEQLQKMITPSARKLFALLLAPRGLSGQADFISYEVSSNSVLQVGKLSESLLSASPDKPVLSVPVDKYYLDPKNYPPNTTNEYIGRIIAEHHLQTLINQTDSNFVSDILNSDIWSENGFVNEPVKDEYMKTLEMQLDIIQQDRNALDIQNRKYINSEPAILSVLFYVLSSHRGLSILKYLRDLKTKENPTENEIKQARQGVEYLKRTTEDLGYISDFFDQFFSALSEIEKKYKKYDNK
jgi:hypothetical protein